MILVTQSLVGRASAAAERSGLNMGEGRRRAAAILLAARVLIEISGVFKYRVSFYVLVLSFLGTCLVSSQVLLACHVLSRALALNSIPSQQPYAHYVNYVIAQNY